MPGPRPAADSSPIRQRYLADRVLLTLLYRPASEEDGIHRLQDGSVLLKMGPVARLFRLNSSRLYDQLTFLHSTGYLDVLDLRYKYGQVRVRPAKCLVQWPTPES